jgi:hypothetical protein
MKFLFITTNWTNAQLLLFTVCVFSFGIIGGLYFYESLKYYLPYITGFSIITAVWIIYLWVKKMRSLGK